MRRQQLSGASGFTLLEMIISTALVATFLILTVMMTHSTRKSAAGAHRRTTLAIRSREVANQIARELQVAGFLGEDLNANGTLEEGEDLDRNGRLDADWSLPDGEAANTITFNVVRRGWTWSAPITYRVENGVLLRLQAGRTLEKCRGVRAFSLTRTGDRIDLRLTLAGADSQGETWSALAERRIHVRN